MTIAQVSARLGQAPGYVHTQIALGTIVPDVGPDGVGGWAGVDISEESVIVFEALHLSRPGPLVELLKTIPAE